MSCTPSILLFPVAFPTFVIPKWYEPFQRGFYCTDVSLRYPYHDDTITMEMLLVGGGCLSIFMDWFAAYIWDSVSTIANFLYGCVFTCLLTEVGKHAVGRLRPHFLDICQPKWSKIDCKNHQYDYIDPIQCTSTNKRDMKEARMSFPSGHASFSAFTMVFYVVYLEKCHMNRIPIRVLRLVQAVCLTAAFYISLSRITDNMHHWEDVMFGFMLGTTVAIVITRDVIPLNMGSSSLPWKQLNRNE
ncbi:hypothetical protein Pcinc_027819 [Petrolisthes cinctipes]|uniref:Phosphatidic acid phosphatase type 2/haloperoxidase domain-containing protein n=1 Tax=Petrolisthes cinctipes TaxID=88211 RepID=A0AAE1F3N5_PETCI|nr:hypothetical protein Pcinc_027819 [Petrolisthes cinctipes]